MTKHPFKYYFKNIGQYQTHKKLQISVTEIFKVYRNTILFPII